jgi:cytochrome b involved in lipid metabolism
MWIIYNNIYDLTNFIKIHPGGEEIIKRTKDLPDITLLFETYHPFANRSKMIEMLEKYRINKLQNSIMYSYNTNDTIKTEHHEVSNVDYDYLLKLN